MQEVRPFIQIFRYDLADKNHDKFERIIINTNDIHQVEWHEDWDFVAFVCDTDHPEGQECMIEDYGDPMEARKRYMNVLTLLGANDGTAMDRVRLMRKAVKKKAKTDAWFRGLIEKAKAAGYDPFKEEDEDKGEQAEVRANGGKAPAGTEGHMD